MREGATAKAKELGVNLSVAAGKFKATTKPSAGDRGLPRLWLEEAIF